MKPEDMDDAQVVGRVLRGQPELFGVILERYQRPIFNFIYRFYGHYDLAEDLTQETFLRCYQFLKSYDPKRKFSTWLYTVAKNLCIDEYRKHHKKDRDFRIDAQPEEVQSADTGTEEGENSQTTQDLKDVFGRCLNRLSERQRLIFVMRHYNQLQYTEIAQILNIAVGTVKSLNFKAIQNLKAHLRPYVGAQS